MATKQEAQEYIIDLILNFIITNIVGINLDNYRRYVDPNTGQITVGSDVADSVVLYETDFRESFSPDLLNTVDEIINECVDLDADNLDDIISDNWNYISGTNQCEGGKG